MSKRASNRWIWAMQNHVFDSLAWIFLFHTVYKDRPHQPDMILFTFHLSPHQNGTHMDLFFGKSESQLIFPVILPLSPMQFAMKIRITKKTVYLPILIVFSTVKAKISKFIQIRPRRHISPWWDEECFDDSWFFAVDLRFVVVWLNWWSGLTVLIRKQPPDFHHKSGDWANFSYNL